MLVIFDCDGVLVDSEPLSNAVLAESLAAVGLRMTPEEATGEFMGRSWKSCLARIEELLGAPPPAALTADYASARDEAFRRGLEAVPGVAAAVDAVDAPRCVASSGDLPKMRFTLGLTGLLDRFGDRLFSATEVEHGKPAPDLFLLAASRMGHPPAECVVVEDSAVGVAGARAAGMRVLGFARRTPADQLAAADAVFGDMADLPGLLAHQPQPDGVTRGRGCAPR